MKRKLKNYAILVFWVAYVSASCEGSKSSLDLEQKPNLSLEESSKQGDANLKLNGLTSEELEKARMAGWTKAIPSDKEDEVIEKDKKDDKSSSSGKSNENSLHNKETNNRANDPLKRSKELKELQKVTDTNGEELSKQRDESLKKIQKDLEEALRKEDQRLEDYKRKMSERSNNDYLESTEDESDEENDNEDEIFDDASDVVESGINLFEQCFIEIDEVDKG